MLDSLLFELCLPNSVRPNDCVFSDYIYNRNHSRDAFTLYLAFEEFTGLINKFPKINWVNLLEAGSLNTFILKTIILNLGPKDIEQFIKAYNIKPTLKNQYSVHR